MPCISNVLYVHDEEVVSDVLWTFSYITDGERPALEAVLDCISVPEVVKFMEHKNPSIKVPAFRLVGNICTGTEADVDKVINHGGLTILKRLINCVQPEKEVLKEACWILSNIAAGPVRHIKILLDVGLIRLLSLVTRTSSDYYVRLRLFKGQVKREAVWAIANAFTEATSELAYEMVREGALLALVAMLDMQEVALLEVLLTALRKVLGHGESSHGLNDLAANFDSLGGLQKLMKLQHHPNDGIYKQSVALMSAHYTLEEDPDPQAESSVGESPSAQC